MDARFCNSLTEGDFGNGAALCQSLVEGDFWARRLGCYCVYAGTGNSLSVDYDRIVTTVTEAGLLVLPGYVSHQADADYFYAARRVSATGKGEQGTMAVVRLSLDAAGSRHLPRANKVRDLRAEPAAEGQVRLSWWYWPIGQEAEPESFAVYGDAGGGTIDYENGLAEVEYDGGCFYSTTIESAGGEKVYAFSVRSVTAEGVEDDSRAMVQVKVDLTGPAAIEGVAGRVCL